MSCTLSTQGSTAAQQRTLAWCAVLQSRLPRSRLFSVGEADAKVDSEVETMVGRASFPIQEPSDGFHKRNVVARGTEDMVGWVQGAEP